MSPLFSQLPRSAPVGQAGGMVPKPGASKQPMVMMSFHERRISHDIIELRSEQQKLSGDVEALRLELGSLKLTAAQRTNQAEIDALQSDVNPSSTTAQATNVVPPPTSVLAASPKTSSLWVTPAKTVDATEVFAKELVCAFEQMETRLNVEITKLKGQMTTTRVAPRSASRDGAPALGQVGSISAEATDLLQQQARALLNLREETRVWRTQVEFKIEDIYRAMEEVKGELPMIALKTGRLALCAVDMGEEDRIAALEAVQLKETQSQLQLGRRGVSPESGDAAQKVSSPRSIFENAVRNLANFDWEKSKETGNGNARQPQLGGSRSLEIPDEHPQLAQVGNERRYFSHSSANEST